CTERGKGMKQCVRKQTVRLDDFRTLAVQRRMNSSCVFNRVKMALTLRSLANCFVFINGNRFDPSHERILIRSSSLSVRYASACRPSEACPTCFRGSCKNHFLTP